MILSIVAITVITCYAFFVQAAFAFGGQLLSLPLLSLFMDPKDAIVLMTIFATLCSLLAFKFLEHIDWRKIAQLMPGLLVGFAAGIALFSWIDRRILGIVLAFYIVIFVANDFFKPKFLMHMGKKIPVNVQAHISGFVGGVFSGLTGTGGPIFVTFLKAHADSVPKFRGTTTFLFLMTNMARLLFFSSENYIHENLLRYALITLPFFGIAIYFGYRLPKKIDDKTFHIVVDCLLLLSAVSLLIKELF